MRARVSLRAGYIAAALIVLAPCASAAPAQQGPQSGLTVVGTFSDGTHTLFVVTEKPTRGKAFKGAMVGVQFERTDENYHFNGTYDKLAAGFMTAEEWRKFVAIWKKARAADGKTEDAYYFDGQTELGLGSSTGGEVSFTLAGNGHDEQDNPKDITSFDLSAKDIPAFDQDVRRVSAYFAK
jgi:hypothetical protein